MNCEIFQKRILENDAQKLSSVEKSHLLECKQCRKFIQLDEKLDTLIRESLPLEEVPEHIKNTLRTNLTDSSKGRKRFLKWSAIPAMAITAMFLFFFMPHGGSFASMDEIGQFAIMDHQSHQGKSCSKGIPDDLSTWGMNNLGMAITLPELPFNDYTLLGVSKCRLGNCDTAHLIYSRNGKRFSVFIFPETETTFSLHNSRNYTLDFGIYQVSIWKSDKLVFTLVS